MIVSHVPSQVKSGGQQKKKDAAVQPLPVFRQTVVQSKVSAGTFERLSFCGVC